MKSWEDYIRMQKEVCSKYGVEWEAVNTEYKVGLADNVLTDINPINGLRHPQEKRTTGWYFWSGNEFSDSKDFFKPYCVKHLVNLKPEIIKYIGLPPGFRILIDGDKYEDVWQDLALLNIG